MIKNHFKITLRKLYNNKAYSLINILGLAIGITACLLIFQYVSHEKSYDGFHKQGDRIYRVAMYKYEQEEPEQSFAFTFPAVAPTMKADFAEIEEAIRMRGQGFITKFEDQVHSERVFFVDEPFLEMFSFPMLKGDPKTALEDSRAVVISERMAKKYFGEQNPVGKELMIDARGDWTSFEVKGVLEDIPENSHMTFDFLYPYHTYSEFVKQSGGDAENSWTWSDFYTYILLKPGIDPQKLQAKFPEFAKRHMGDLFSKFGYQIKYELQPLLDIHLHSDLAYELGSNGNANYVWAMTVIAFFILLIAWINYINLSTARSLDRAKEVGVRKVVGASRNQLIRQFLFETLLVNLLAFVIGLVLFQLTLPYFEDLTGKVLTDSLLSNGRFWVLLITLFGLGALLSGMYPAFLLSGFKPITALKSNLSIGQIKFSNTLLRKVLVGTQFFFSVALIAGTLALYKQILHMRYQDLGVNINQTLVLRDSGSRDSTYVERIQSFKSALVQNPEIRSVVGSGDIPGKEVGNSWNLRWGKAAETEMKRTRTLRVDDQFMDEYGLKLIAGRAFSNDYGLERNTWILNETAVKVFGFDSPQAALNEELFSSDGTNQGRIVGVIKDYHQESLRFNFKPIAYYYDNNNFSYYSLKIQTSDFPALLTYVEREWDAYFSNTPFNHFFLDEFYDQQYKADIQFGWVIALFFILAILVACLGLFGLSSFTVARRTKEIGIRKVLGASIGQILMLISKDFMRLLLWASIIALPFAWYFANQWLSAYAFKITLNVWFFILPIIIIALIAWLTVGWQSFRAAVSNPVKALRTE